MVVDETGKRVWENLDLYLSEKEQGLAQQARFEVMLYLQGLSSDFLDQTPEAVAIREIEQETLEAIQAEIRRAAEEEEAAEEAKKTAAATKAKPKTTRKKTTTRKTTTTARKTTRKPRAKKSE